MKEGGREGRETGREKDREGGGKKYMRKRRPRQLVRLEIRK